MPFQSRVNALNPVAVAGDFASANPRFTMLAGPRELTAGEDGVTIGIFAFARNDNGKVYNAHPGVASRIGFVARYNPAVITDWLAESSMKINPGLDMTLMTEGDFWASFAAGATIGQKVFVDYLTGVPFAGAAGATPETATGTGSVGASVTGTIGTTATAAVGFTGTGAISGSTLTISAITGKAHVGDIVTGPGGSSDPIAANTVITQQLTGTAGSTGTYSVSVSQTSTSAAIVGASTIATVSAIASGALAVGDVITGSAGWPIGAQKAVIQSQLTGTAGAAGDYQLTVATAFQDASAGISAPSTRLTVSAVGSGVLHLGDKITTGAASDTFITALGTGTGGTGTYTVTPAQYVASTTLGTDSDVLDLTVLATGSFGGGMPITGSGVDTGTVIVEQLTGTAGGVGTYRISPQQAAVASTAITGTGALETAFSIQSNAGDGELAKISAH